MRERWIDCYGRSYPGDVRVVVDDEAVVFAYTSEGKRGRPFTQGLFLDDTTVSRAPYRYPKRRRVALLLESPLKPFYREGDHLARTFDRVFTFSQDLLGRGAPFALFPYGMSWIPEASGGAPPAKTRLVSFVGSIQHDDTNGYAVRRDVVRRLAAGGSVELFGKGIREVASKLEALEPYAFSIAMENTRHNYYFTEKIIDCFLTATIPIYWGCPEIGRFFDAKGILAFQTADELEAILGSLSWERYEDLRLHAEKNRETVLSAGWHTYNGLYTRLGRCIVARQPSLDAVSPRRRSRAAAGLRWLTEGLLNR